VSQEVFALERASVRYPRAAAPSLAEATLAVRAGECVGLVGPNGAGKTTALRAVLGIAALTGGTARVFGRDIGAWSRSELARAVGVLNQREEPVFPLTVREAVTMGRYPYLDAWRGLGAADRAAARRAMERADVAGLADRWVGTLSGGEWQRVRLARALAQEPRALVLDEPSSSLDLRHEMELFELVIDLVRRDGLAALVVSHHLNVAARFCDRLVLFDRGRVALDGLPASVLAPDRLSAVFGWPIAVHELPDGTPQLVPERRPVTHLEQVSS
jgi:iron complex transport system ATP-binding protein